MGLCFLLSPVAEGGGLPSPTKKSQHSVQSYVAAWMGGEFGGEWIHGYIWLSPFAVRLKLSQRC